MRVEIDENLFQGRDSKVDYTASYQPVLFCAHSSSPAPCLPTEGHGRRDYPTPRNIAEILRDGRPRVTVKTANRHTPIYTAKIFNLQPNS